MNKLPLLSSEQIQQKLIRMAYEIWEQNSKENELIMIGLEQGGAVLANNLATILHEISPLKIKMISLQVNKKKPLADRALKIETDLNKKTVILVDDVANSGKTLLYALRPIMEYEPAKIKIVVLVDRKHKSYPVTPDIVGHSVSTTLQDHIVVNYKDNKITTAHLE
jgi:pyrimidine operon attenuation protein/uracil phosphoribosyltransferase